MENLHPDGLFQIGEVLRYQDFRGAARNCTVKDSGTNGVKSWYIITHDGNDEAVVFEEELKDCLLF
jgi:hypothetical protein